MLDKLRQVAIFAKTIDHGSFRGAARELDLSPSVVSHHISQLEEQLGVALIYRSTRKLALTREGERLLASTHSMFDSVESALTDLSNNANRPSGELRLTIPSVLVRSALTEQLGAFSVAYPNIKLDLNYTDERLDLIASGLDIAIRMELKSQSSATKRTLFKVPRRIIASPAYLKGRKKPKTPKDLSDWDWIDLTPVRHRKPTLKKARSSQTINTKSHLCASDALAVYQLVCAGAGVAVVPENLLDDDFAAGRVNILLPDWQIDPITVAATWPASAPRHGLIKLLVDEISPNRTLS